jgi:hypothetical protein
MERRHRRPRTHLLALARQVERPRE